MIKLLSTDFDGTVVNHDAEPAVEPAFLEMLAELRRQGALWAVNTGRTLAHIEEGLQEFNFSIEPDFVLTSEREVFHRAPDGRWQDYGDWNERCTRAHESLFAKSTELIADICDFLDRHALSHPIFEGGRLIGLVADNDEEMDRVCEFLRRERGRVPGFQFMRNTVYVRFCHEDYSKGTALGELARLTGVAREHIFAAGDHFNDVPMLDGRHAAWVACPSNAVDGVKRAVREAGGYVASSPCSAGIVEALHHFGALNGGELGAESETAARVSTLISQRSTTL